ncbi:ribonucleoside triphosphate reductase [Parasutterella muris]|nr:ribonucleoside triphosphate reductase [Parasutterella muris]
MITSIIKRDGSIEPFNPAKISEAVAKAGVATNEFGTMVANEIVRQMVIPAINAHKGRTISVEEVQDIVEKALFNSSFESTYKAYAIYRHEHTKARETKKVAVDVESSINEYINQDDWRVKANANQGYSLGGMILNVSGKVVANYWLSSVYPKEVGLAHRNGDFHIHDLDMLSGYCCGHSLRALLNEGFNGVPNKVSSNPPKHLSSALSQAVNFLGTLQNEWAGAQAFSSFDTYLAPFVRLDNLPYEEVKQNIQEFIFNLNVPSRWGTQTPFTNLTFDIHCPDDLKEQHPIIGGEEVDFTYGELQKEMDMINRAYIEVMTEGDAQGRVFTFPIPTYNITDDFDWDSENSKLMFEMTAKYGLPYFQNFMNSDLDPHMIRSMCPLAPTTKLRVRIGEVLECTVDIGKLSGIKDKIEVLYKNEWHRAKLVRATKQKTRKIFCSNAEYVEMGVHHLQPVIIDGKVVTLAGSDLACGMKLPKDDSCLDYTRIIDIQEGEERDDLYCFEVENEEHLFTLANGLVTHNCRLRLDLTELLHRGNGLFGSAEQTGSIGVVTINCARLGYCFKNDWEGLLKRFDYLCDLAKTSLELKRKTITRLMKEGLYPYTNRYLGGFKNFFSTIGVNGVNEMIRNFSGDEYDITSVQGHTMAVELLQHLNKRIQQYQEETGNLYNSEATPAEGTATRFAREDRKRFPNIIQAGAEGERYYTNSTQLPVGFTDDPFDALDHQEDLQRLYLGGTVLHLYMGERVSSWKAARDIVKKTFSHYQLPYITITPTFSICPKHGYIAGAHEFCPKCDAELITKKMKQREKENA